MGKKHVCHSYCHKCPDLDGQVMPMCMGTTDRNDFERCTCDRPAIVKAEAQEKQIRRLQAACRNFEERISKLEQSA